MEEEPPRKRGRPITRREDWESTQKRIHLSTSTFERWQALKSTLALESDDAVVSYLLDFHVLHVHRDECSIPGQKEPDPERSDLQLLGGETSKLREELSVQTEWANNQQSTLNVHVEGHSQ